MGAKAAESCVRWGLGLGGGAESKAASSRLGSGLLRLLTKAEPATCLAKSEAGLLSWSGLAETKPTSSGGSSGRLLAKAKAPSGRDTEASVGRCSRLAKVKTTKTSYEEEKWKREKEEMRMSDGGDRGRGKEEMSTRIKTEIGESTRGR